MKELTRFSEIKRKTNETNIELTLTIEGTGKSEIRSGSAFLDHMLTLLARHSGFDLTVKCDGDTEVDCHHTTEDIGICLGQALRECLGDKAGIVRYAHTILPMDETLILSALDISGRSYFASELDIKSGKVGDFDTELVYEFFQAFAMNAGLTLHIKQLAGSNSHHIIEGVFKSVARSLKTACAIDPTLGGRILSTKGVL